MRFPFTRFRSSPRGGFTLLEVLLTLALLGLFATILVGGSTRLLTSEPATPGQVFWKAVREARKRALKAEHEIRLRFDDEKKAFVLINGAAPTLVGDDGITRVEAALQTFAVPSPAPDLGVDLLGRTKGGRVIVVRGKTIEADPIAFVTFYPDGTCTPFRAQFRVQDGVHVLEVDPWTCAPVLTPADGDEFRP